MMALARQVWRAAPTTLAGVVTFLVVAAVAIPFFAYLVYQDNRSALVPILLLVLTCAVLTYAWRFGLHPKVQADARGVRVVNPFRNSRFDWDEITVVFPCENGLIIASPNQRAEAWCVQKSRYAIRRGIYTRADAVARELLGLIDAVESDSNETAEDVRIRRARPDEVRRLGRMERAVSETALAHIFPPEDYPYPVEEITRRWHRLLQNPGVRVRLLDAFDAPVAYVAYDNERVRHLGVLPHQSGQGYGTLLLEHACAEIFASGSREAHLWVLVDNTRAREFYQARGWTETGERRDCEFPPFPPELRMVRPNPAAPRRLR